MAWPTCGGGRSVSVRRPSSPSPPLPSATSCAPPREASATSERSGGRLSRRLGQAEEARKRDDRGAHDDVLRPEVADGACGQVGHDQPPPSTPATDCI